ncbi:hypothetical protein F4677DRAFT_385891 [Hypoxylon crocopeplum]|nr:hypothetical protein F4677DRAFT_385891 [Hypoxylon crocopeplum]
MKSFAGRYGNSAPAPWRLSPLYILADVAPDQAVQSITTPEQVRGLRENVRMGECPVAPGAAAISDLIQDAWMLKTKTTLSEIAAEVSRRLNSSLGGSDELGSPPSEEYHAALSTRCQEWLEKQQPDSR